MPPFHGYLGARVDLQCLCHARAIAEEMPCEVIGAAGECIAAARIRAWDRFVVFGRVMSIGVIETWECALALCTNKAVGSLERVHLSVQPISGVFRVKRGERGGDVH